ncbi:hypothetical protein IB238_23040 [Rhizobium sp. ARZ01]|uniref:hypothetical protein n=1 Tax=Rhizobium sp. ARZ01 TaxID=2769313 RepID=UPI001781CB35|nr:hypothetical protein [Rhizobium sp. ARZ01]MBD9375495.1 hypothetical protein [Rhizobium sp. ARZ01]
MGRRGKSLTEGPDAEQLVKAFVHDEASALLRIVQEISQRYPGRDDLQLLHHLLGMVVQLTQPETVPHSN